MKKDDNLYQIGKQRERNDQKTGESNSDTSRTRTVTSLTSKFGLDTTMRTLIGAAWLGTRII